MGFKTQCGTILLASLTACIFLNLPASAAQRELWSPPKGNESLVAANCTTPTKITGRDFYVDPTRGKITNDGSAERPWDSLANVMAKTQITFKAGDTVYLMNGDHGNVNMFSKYNDGFVTVKAADGQVPILKSLTVSGSKWIFSGMKVQGIKGITNGSAHVNIRSIAGKPSNDIIFTGNAVTSQDDTDNWSQADWKTKALGGVTVDGRNGTYCVAITNNNIYNIVAGLGMFVDRGVADNNKIDNFTSDGITFGGNNLTLSHNRITNIVDVADGIHPDAMQGFVPGGTGWSATSYSNVTIDGNTIIRQTNPNQKFPNVLQGIDNFNSAKSLLWYNLKVINNVVITNAYHGIFFAGVQGGLIANNTVLADGKALSTNYWTAQGLQTVGTSGNMTWIGLGDSPDPSRNVVVRNNITQTLNIGATSHTVTVDHNIVSKQISQYLQGKMQYFSKAGIYGDSNIVDPNLNTGFVKFDQVNHLYDIRLKDGSPAIGKGSTQAPQTDIAGALRSVPVSLGAYNYVPQSSSKLTFLANARQVGSPKLILSANGRKIGEAAITADAHTGKTAVYSIDLPVSVSLEKMQLSLSGYTTTKNKYTSVNIFKLVVTKDNKATSNLMKTATMKVVSGEATTSPLQFFTNGATVEIDPTP